MVTLSLTSVPTSCPSHLSITSVLLLCLVMLYYLGKLKGVVDIQKKKTVNLCTNILNLKLVGSMASDPADAAGWQSCEQTGLWGFASYYFILDVRVFLYQIISQVTVQWRHSCFSAL